jgi:hypothetical protein
VVARKRGYIRSLSLRTSNPSHDETFNAFNRAWLHNHSKTLLGHLLTFHPSAVDKEIIVDLLVWLPFSNCVDALGGTAAHVDVQNYHPEFILLLSTSYYTMHLTLLLH